MYPMDALISKYLSESRNSAYGEIAVWKDIYSGNVNSDFVIYGASRAWGSISSKMIQDSLHISTYNLGIDGHNFWLQYLRHKELLKYNKKPSQVVISVDWSTLEKNSDLYNYQQFLPFLLWNNDIKHYTSSYSGFSTYDYNIPLIRYYGEWTSILDAVKSAVNYKNNNIRVKGYRGVDRRWNDDFDKAKSKINKYEMQLDSASVKLFEQFIQECIDNKIRLTLVYVPEYIEGQAFVTNRSEIISKYKYFAEKYDIQFIDYSKDKMNLSKQFFYNSSHLNKKGSEKFTIKLIRKLHLKDELNIEINAE